MMALCRESRADEVPREPSAFPMTEVVMLARDGERERMNAVEDMMEERL
jgi:hypothetical protein